jgi:hypothetical protein
MHASTVSHGDGPAYQGNASQWLVEFAIVLFGPLQFSHRHVALVLRKLPLFIDL